MNMALNRRAQSPLAQTFLVLAVATTFLFMWSDVAAAQAINLSPVTSFITTITSALTGTLGKAIATLALVGVAITWFFGIIDFRQAMWVIVAIVFVGSASLIVNSLWTTT